MTHITEIARKRKSERTGERFAALDADAPLGPRWISRVYHTYMHTHIYMCICKSLPARSLTPFFLSRSLSLARLFFSLKMSMHLLLRSERGREIGRERGREIEKEREREKAERETKIKKAASERERKIRQREREREMCVLTCSGFLEYITCICT